MLIKFFERGTKKNAFILIKWNIIPSTMNNEMNVVVFWKIYKIIPELLTVQRLNDIQLRTPVVVHFSDQLIHEWNSNTFRERYEGKKKNWTRSLFEDWRMNFHSFFLFTWTWWMKQNVKVQINIHSQQSSVIYRKKIASIH